MAGLGPRDEDLVRSGDRRAPEEANRVGDAVMVFDFGTETWSRWEGWIVVGWLSFGWWKRGQICLICKGVGFVDGGWCRYYGISSNVFVYNRLHSLVRFFWRKLRMLQNMCVGGWGA